jgi:hypothetical protein
MNRARAQRLDGATTLPASTARAIQAPELFEPEPVVEHLERADQRLQTEVEQADRREGVAGHFAMAGYACNLASAALDADHKHAANLSTGEPMRPRSG